ncbi:hypothetical protein LINPERHAP1_LOCUS29403 [Linum perenne]
MSSVSVPPPQAPIGMMASDGYRPWLMVTRENWRIQRESVTENVDNKKRKADNPPTRSKEDELSGRNSYGKLKVYGEKISAGKPSTAKEKEVNKPQTSAPKDKGDGPVKDSLMKSLTKGNGPAKGKVKA